MEGIVDILKMQLIQLFVKTQINMKKTPVMTSASFKVVCLGFVLCLAMHTASARKVYSLSPGGAWTSASSWVGGTVPAANDTVFIQGGHTISLSTNEGSNSTYMFLIIIGTLDLSNNGKLSFSGTSKVIITNSGRILGNSNGDQISIGTAGSEYSGGSQGNITGPSYIGDGHSPVSGEGTAGCGCYNSVSSCSFTSSAGYTVYITVSAKSLVKPPTCVNGYNYNVRLDYNISFSGSNIPPGGLYTLQGNINCGGQSIFFDLPNTAGAGTVTTTGNPWRPNSDCATATIASLGCTSAILNVEGNGIAATTCSSSTLPITLISFTGRSTDEGVDLNWVTSMEKNFDYFLVERAGDDLNFRPLTQVAGKGGLEMTTSYDYLDQSSRHGKNYYRLKSVDLDGTFEYSKVILVNRVGKTDGINVYPTLIDRSFTVEVNDALESPVNLVLMNAVGNAVYRTELTSGTADIEVPAAVKPGVYLVKLFSPSGQKAVRVVIK
jgi:hypothetical protein